MKHWFGFLLLLSGPLAAMPPGKLHPSFFQRYDANGDGVITREEFDRKGSELFSRLDRDGDGKITRQEFWRGLLRHRFQKLDRNGDGQISWEEFLRAHRRLRGQSHP